MVPSLWRYMIYIYIAQTYLDHSINMQHHPHDMVRVPLPQWYRLSTSRRSPSSSFSVETMRFGGLYVQIWWMQPKWTSDSLRTQQVDRIPWISLVPVAWGSIPSCFLMLDVYIDEISPNTVVLMSCRVNFAQQTKLLLWSAYERIHAKKATKVIYPPYSIISDGSLLYDVGDCMFFLGMAEFLHFLSQLAPPRGWYGETLHSCC